MKFLRKAIFTGVIIILAFGILSITALFFENITVKNNFVLFSKAAIARTADVFVKYIYDPAKGRRQYALTGPGEKIGSPEGWISDRAGLELFIARRYSGKLAVLEYDNQPNMRSAYEFSYQPYGEDRLRSLRDKYGLEGVLRQAKDEYSAMVELKSWVHSRWELGQPKDVPYNFDALQILSRAGKGERFFCSEYATVFVQAALSLGFNARYVGLLKGHMVAEAWSHQYNKWVVMDPAYNARYFKDGVPLNSLELHQLWCRGEWGQVQVIADDPQPKGFSVFDSELHLIDFYENFYIRMRNDWFTNRYPHWHPLSNSIMNGLEWKDACTKDSIMITRQTKNPQDLYWSLDRAAIQLKCRNPSAAPIEFDVFFDTVTPNFKEFIVTVDKRKFRSAQPYFKWALHKGRNILRAAPVNQFGVEGAESAIILSCN